MNERKAMINAKQRISMSQQCQLLAVSRASLYTHDRGVSTADVEQMRGIDELYLKWPFYGSRRLCKEIRQGVFGQSEAGATLDAPDES